MKKITTIQAEIDAAYLYEVLASEETDPQVKQVFREMSAIERGHALAFIKQSNLSETLLHQVSWRAKVLHRIGSIFGYHHILSSLLETEKSISNQIKQQKSKHNITNAITDNAHVKILENILANANVSSVQQIARFESRHKSVGGNALRAAVLGGNDGLISNFSLVMGVAGASAGQKEVLLAGLAGLLAGSLSMALGEWISVKSSQELYENQMDLEMEELEINPAGEEQELALIYQSKGIAAEQAKQMASEIMKDKTLAHAILIKEELGIVPEDLKSSAMEAAISSFLLFAIGAVIPIIPFFLSTGNTAILWSIILSGIGLFLIGAIITIFTRKNVWFSGLRQVLFGLMAAAITFGIGKLIGVSLI